MFAPPSSHLPLGGFMKRCLIVALAVLAMPIVVAAAEEQKAESKPVAVVNGEIVTADKLNEMYRHLSAPMRAQYEATGGKAGFLENYLRKRLLIQEAVKSGFD